jgi:hypothetical protein
MLENELLQNELKHHDIKFKNHKTESLRKHYEEKLGKKWDSTDKDALKRLYKEKYNKDWEEEWKEEKEYREYMRSVEEESPSRLGDGIVRFTPYRNRKRLKVGKGNSIVFLPSDEKNLREIMNKDISAIRSGNKSTAVKNQLSAILDRFVEMKKLSNDQRRAILKQYM